MLSSAQRSALMQGTLYTIEIAFVALFFGAILGVIIALGRMSKNKIAKGISWFYVWFFRGTPLMLQLFILYYAFPLIYLNITGTPFGEMNQLTVAFIAYSLNSAAYMAEIIRAAIESIPDGQMEAAKALGMTYGQAMRKIIIPQTFKRLVAPLGNELIMLIKDTSLVSTIALSDLLRVVKNVVNGTGIWQYYGYAVVIYLFLTTIFQLIFDKLEDRFGAYEKR